MKSLSRAIIAGGIRSVKALAGLAHAQFFPLPLVRSKRGEGPSRTLNKGVTLPWLTGGLLPSLPAYLQLPAIPLQNPSHRSLARRLPPDSACLKALPLALALPLHLSWAKQYEETGGGQDMPRIDTKNPFWLIRVIG